MKKFQEAVKRFLCEEEGTEIVEWALVGGLLVAVGAAIFSVIGTDTKGALETLSTEVAKANPGSTGG
ncbi:MAG: hypothetical protein R3175_00900 [Marinobacter sp.]|uniref:Flp family type IVb pilin n=1 Tax=Marinobacter sp. TaxID=50741 RepID=UPI00299E60D8|nr:hypothetical protein [Marinobacter sp.]MDX1754599.1 hypothetical protein [Marinobacter sp.]